MLQLTPAARKMIRNARRAREPNDGRQLGEQRHKQLVAKVAVILRKGEPTLFRYEGECIAAVRMKLILAGRWTWRDADRAAREVVLDALRQVGAKRPRWDEASTPDYAQAGTFTLYERVRCKQCGGGLPEENRLFCTTGCRSLWHSRKAWAERAALIEEGL